MQSINLEGILYYPIVKFLKKSLAVPHFSVKDISKINPEKLKECGFKGLVFDKDNTITAPYVDEIYETIKETFEHYRHVFGMNMVIMSNSAGTNDDKNYEAARRIEKELRIHVLRHSRKKPGGIKAVMEYFHWLPEELVMFGDRILTDVVFGNRYGMLTVHTALLTEEGDNKAAAKIRKIEIPMLNKLRSKGIKAPEHRSYQPDICLEELEYIVKSESM